MVTNSNNAIPEAQLATGKRLASFLGKRLAVVRLYSELIPSYQKPVRDKELVRLENIMEFDMWDSYGDYTPTSKEKETGERIAIYLGQRVAVARLYGEQHLSQAMSVSDPSVLLDFFMINPLEVGEDYCDATYSENVKFFNKFDVDKRFWLLSGIKRYVNTIMPLIA